MVNQASKLRRVRVYLSRNLPFHDYDRFDISNLSNFQYEDV